MLRQFLRYIASYTETQIRSAVFLMDGNIGAGSIWSIWREGFFSFVKAVSYKGLGLRGLGCLPFPDRRNA